ncbi:MAG: aminoacyl-tRNA hydrolase [Aristaeellaceae bacterium]
MDKETFLVVGLGNPGAQYAHTRHNAGFEVTDILSARWNAPLTRRKLDGLLAEIPMGDARVVLCQPQTFMNLSGECVAQLLSWYKCPLDHLLVIYDDIDLPLGKLRVRKAGSAGTHNGMRSIIGHTPAQSFPRIRVGVGARPEGWDLADWVLSRYQFREEQDAMREAFIRAADCVEDWLKNGIDHAMQRYNGQ